MLVLPVIKGAIVELPVIMLRLVLLSATPVILLKVVGQANSIVLTLRQVVVMQLPVMELMLTVLQVAIQRLFLSVLRATVVVMGLTLVIGVIPAPLFVL